MKKTELRIGNQILIDGVVVTVDERTLFDFDYDGRVKEPIVLTENILLRLGFKRESKYDFVLKNLDFEIDVYYCSGWDDINNGKGSITFVGGYGINFEFLHNLQNLYFVLTNKEIKLP